MDYERLHSFTLFVKNKTTNKSKSEIIKLYLVTFSKFSTFTPAIDSWLSQNLYLDSCLDSQDR